MSRCERQDRDAYPQGRVQSRAICELKGGCAPIRRFYFRGRNFRLRNTKHPKNSAAPKERRPSFCAKSRCPKFAILPEKPEPGRAGRKSPSRLRTSAHPIARGFFLRVRSEPPFIRESGRVPTRPHPEATPMMTEDLSGLPLHAEIRETLRAMIARGHDPLEVAEAAQVVASALSVSIEGEVRAGAKLYAAGLALLENSRKHAAA